MPKTILQNEFLKCLWIFEHYKIDKSLPILNYTKKEILKLLTICGSLFAAIYIFYIAMIKVWSCWQQPANNLWWKTPDLCLGRTSGASQVCWKTSSTWKFSTQSALEPTRWGAEDLQVGNSNLSATGTPFIIFFPCKHFCFNEGMILLA